VDTSSAIGVKGPVLRMRDDEVLLAYTSASLIEPMGDTLYGAMVIYELDVLDPAAELEEPHIYGDPSAGGDLADEFDLLIGRDYTFAAWATQSFGYSTLHIDAITRGSWDKNSVSITSYTPDDYLSVSLGYGYAESSSSALADSVSALACGPSGLQVYWDYAYYLASGTIDDGATTFSYGMPTSSCSHYLAVEDHGTGSYGATLNYRLKADGGSPGTYSGYLNFGDTSLATTGSWASDQRAVKYRSANDHLGRISSYGAYGSEDPFIEWTLSPGWMIFDSAYSQIMFMPEELAKVDIGYDLDGMTIACGVGDSGSPYVFYGDPVGGVDIEMVDLSTTLGSTDDCSVTVGAGGEVFLAFRDGDELWLAAAMTH
jgi:hypothetical protein